MRRLLELQANQTEMVQSGPRMPLRVVGGTVTLHALRCQLAKRMGTRISKIQRLSAEITLCLKSPSHSVVWDNGALNTEVPRAQPTRVPLLNLCRRLTHIHAACGRLAPCAG